MSCRHIALILGIVAGLWSSSTWAQGMLIPVDESLAPLQLRQHRVELRIEDHAAVTHVSQVFANHTWQNLEATYYFAVPEGAVTTDFAIWMNGERIRGEVLERDQARQAYQNIVRRLRDPGLLEYIDGTLFQASIFPIPARGEQTVEIEFASVLPQVGTMLQYQYPIHGSTGDTLPQFVVSGDISSSQEIASVYSPHHEIEVDRQDAYHVRVSMEASSAPVNRDFSLFVGRTGDAVGFSLLTYDPDGAGGEQGYFMMALSPSYNLDESSVLPKQLTLVVDTSGSMRGAKLAQAQELLRYCVDHLKAEDTFNIVSFSTRIRSAFDEHRPATEENRLAALDFVEGLRARGNTNISGALTAALENTGTPDRPHIVLFVTDGLPTEGETDVASIIDLVRQQADEGYRRLFAFGVGYDVNTRLIEGVARSGRGRTGYVRPEENIREVVGQFYDHVSAPVMTDIHVDFGSMLASQVFPDPLPDLYRGDQLTLFGRYQNPLDSTLTIQGETSNATVTLTHEATLAGDDRASDQSRSFVGSLWAHRRIAALMDEINEQGENQERISKVVELATHWGIVTPYTSYLALDPSERLMPVAGLEGWDGDETGEWRRTQEETTQLDGAAGFGERGGTLQVQTSPSAPPTEAHWQARVGRDRSPEPTVPADISSSPARAQVHSRLGEPMRARGLGGETGAVAVEAAIDANEDRERLVLADQVDLSRYASGRNFTRDGEVWVEQGLSGRETDRFVGYLSDEYFALLDAHPEIGEILALGAHIRFELDGLVYEIRP